MIAREGTKTVGSRLKQVVGSCRTVDTLTRKFRDGQAIGVTRVEISLHLDDDPETNQLSQMVEASFAERLANMIGVTTAHVLNDVHLQPIFSKCINLSRLLTNLGAC